MAHRGSSGLSFMLGIDKPAGMTSHDVVNKVRSIFGERRVGHVGTLDPLATGVLGICVGPATRLDAYLAADEKVYSCRIVFGSATDTDDAEGTVIRRAPVPEDAYDPEFAQRFLGDLVGSHEQLPPAYSAVKVAGQKSYEAARAGHIIDLTPRTIRIYDADLLGVGIDDADTLHWDVHVRVSKGTYIRSLARDIGVSLSSAAHVGSLRRTRSGAISISDCVTLDALLADPSCGRIDPCRALAKRILFVPEQSTLESDIANGKRISAEGLILYDIPVAQGHGCACCATQGPQVSSKPLLDGEIISVVSHGALTALYEYVAAHNILKSRCGFFIGVERGSDI